MVFRCIVLCGGGKTTMTNFLVRLWREDQGQDLVEYALMAGFVAAAALAIIPRLAKNLFAFLSAEDLLLRLIALSVALGMLIVIVRRRRGQADL